MISRIQVYNTVYVVYMKFIIYVIFDIKQLYFTISYFIWINESA